MMTSPHLTHILGDNNNDILIDFLCLQRSYSKFTKEVSKTLKPPSGFTRNFRYKSHWGINYVSIHYQFSNIWLVFVLFPLEKRCL